MPRYCEVTRKKIPHAANVAEGEKANLGSLRRRLIDVPEFKTKVRVTLSPEGFDVLKKEGGLVNFLKKQDTKGLSANLKKIKSLIPEEKKEEATEEKAEEAAAAAEETKKEEVAPEAEEKKEGES